MKDRHSWEQTSKDTWVCKHCGCSRSLSWRKANVRGKYYNRSNYVYCDFESRAWSDKAPPCRRNIGQEFFFDSEFEHIQREE